MGEEEATMRERLVEAMARAISRTNGWPQDMWDNPEEYSTSRVAKEAYVAWASSALDAALYLLETPSKEMVAQYAAKQGAILDDTFGPRSSHDHAAGRTEQSHEQFQQMLGILLATLRSPKI
jgi:hypothetical protein